MIQVLQYHGISFPVSTSIRWWTGFSHTHSSLYFTRGAVEFAAWQRGGCHFSEGIGADHSKDTLVDVFNWPLSEEDQEKVLQFCKETDGMGYDFPGVFGFMFHRAMQNPDAYFCCEHVITASQRTGNPILNGCPSKFYPGHVAASPAIKYSHSLRVGAT